VGACKKLVQLLETAVAQKELQLILKLKRSGGGDICDRQGMLREFQFKLRKFGDNMTPGILDDRMLPRISLVHLPGYI